jgi:plastocyanin
MSRFIRTAIACAVALAAVGSAAPLSAAPAAGVNGTVGPGFTISLTMSGKKVTTLKAGVPYRFVVNDRSAAHNFHLSGPGSNRVLTSVAFTGRKTFTLRLKKGNHRFVCDPHASAMRGSFRVT